MLPGQPRGETMSALAYRSLAHEAEDALLPEQIPDPGLAKSQWRAKTVERQATLDMGADLLREDDKIVNGTKMDVWRLVPGASQVASDRHPAAKSNLKANPPMTEIRK